MTSKSSITIDDMNLPAIHPGEILTEELETIGVSVTAFARALDVPQSRIAEIVAEKRAITADTALRIATYFGTTPRFWMSLQADYDLAIAEEKNGDHIREVVRRKAA